MAIKITPDEIRDLAGKLDSNASDTEGIASTITSNFNVGTENFEGNTADRYAEAFKEMIPIMSQKMPQLLRDMATELRRTADNFEQLDG